MERVPFYDCGGGCPGNDRSLPSASLREGETPRQAAPAVRLGARHGYLGRPGHLPCPRRGRGHRAGHGLRRAGTTLSHGAGGAMGHANTPGTSWPAAAEPPGLRRGPRGGVRALRARLGSPGGERPPPPPAADRRGRCGDPADERLRSQARPAPAGPPTPPRVHMSEFTDLAAAFTTLSCKRADIKPL